MEKIITLNRDNLAKEHICCAFSDKKCQEGYELKKEWLKKELDNGYVFRRIDARAKVFIEYGPAEKGWAPIEAPNYLLINCFWVSGKYKSQGYGKSLLQHAIDDAKAQNKNGLATVAGTGKLPFMSDTKWLLRQGFEVCQKLPNGFCLLVYRINLAANLPMFKESALSMEIQNSKGLKAYYSNRCPFTEYYVRTSLTETAQKRNLPLEIVKIETMEQAQAAPTPATIFSLFYNGKLITTDLSVCTESRFDRIVNGELR